MRRKKINESPQLRRHLATGRPEKIEMAALTGVVPEYLDQLAIRQCVANNEISGVGDSQPCSAKLIRPSTELHTIERGNSNSTGWSSRVKTHACNFPVLGNLKWMHDA